MKPKDKRPLPKAHRRCLQNDYHGRCIYMITLCTEGHLPILGTLEGDYPEAAFIRPTLLGEKVLQCWKDIPTLQKQFAAKKSERTGEKCQRNISLIAAQLMPDHFHGIIFVREEMDISVGDVVRGFMVGCTKAYNALLPTPPDEKPLKPLWEKGYHDRILRHAGQLQNMINYVWDNPRRLMMKRQHSDCFAVLRNVRFGGHTFSTVGNLHLLDYPLRAVHVRSKWSDSERRNYMNRCIVKARQGAALIGPFISPWEKLVLEAALREGLPVIQLVPNGFSNYYKPSGGFLNACSRGKMLFMTEATSEDPFSKRITREECVSLNALAGELASQQSG
ncbi:MAG: transposase [Bacteroidales bacterium]|nr:transposase [Bacteroidales bacterium]